jgi:hypothetical protein
LIVGIIIAIFFRFVLFIYVCISFSPCNVITVIIIIFKIFCDVCLV